MRDDADIDGAKLKQETEIIQVAIKEWILIVPFQFQGDAPFEAIDEMGRA